ncbi:DNA ligase D [Lentzea sp. NBRC 105346]|uniref:non-homologous end-joining DNA ligase LigD n=1 Tax=Lentzea sp. NBRC 105346 TaxID=3032205 RepID=UPI0024A388F5|nr:DNA ligase D [Lentzea sp. NBRC 105346]GLZ35002.1 DNA ligase D [Lentzea sp. NBRC 105346]
MVRPGPVPAWVEPMLAKPDGGRLRSGPPWAYEYKLDGFRAAMRVAPDGTTVLTSRNGIDFTNEFRTVTGVLTEALDGRAAVLDGEIVVYNEAGQIDFELLQARRGRYQKHRGAIEDVPVRYLAFDLLRLGDRMLLGEPYDERRRLLTSLPMPDPYLVAVVRAFTFDELAADRTTPEQLLGRVAVDGLEGLVAKRRDSLYTPGKRTDAWLKHPLVQTREVIVCGWKPGQRSFTGTLGGMLLGAHDPATGELVYIGDVGTGFSERDRADLQARLEKLERRTHPFATTPPREDVVRARWVEPVLVGEVRFRQFTRGAGRLRGTSWRGLRPDKSPAEVIAPQAGEPRPEPAEPTRITVRVGERRLVLSDLDKVLYPDGFTKGEVINYYSRVAPVLLPHLRGRPVTVPGEAPGWLRTVRRSGVEYALIDDLPALVWAVNQGTVELHLPQWTIDDDLLVLGLEPGPGASIVDCCRAAERLYDVLTGDGLVPVVKTSGSQGLHIWARTPGETYAKAYHDDKVLIEWNADPTIAPYSLCGGHEPMVSTPLTWDEVRDCRDAAELVFTADEVLDRVAEYGDLFSEVRYSPAPPARDAGSGSSPADR